MKISPHPQGSEEWLKARAGIPTASEFKHLLTPLFKVKTGEARESFLNRKIAEAWLGHPLTDNQSFSQKSRAMEQGQILETEAVPWMEFARDVKIQRVGLCLTDDGRVGASPDGLIGEDSGVEIKCPEADTHVGYLREGGLPEEYAAQVHGCMYVTGRPRWRFLSYRRDFPPFEITVERDESIQSRIHEALTKFLADFDSAMAKLKSIQ